MAMPDQCLDPQGVPDIKKPAGRQAVFQLECEVAYKPCHGDYSGHPALHPFGAGLRPFKIVPDNFVDPSRAVPD